MTHLASKFIKINLQEKYQKTLSSTAAIDFKNANIFDYLLISLGFPYQNKQASSPLGLVSGCLSSLIFITFTFITLGGMELESLCQLSFTQESFYETKGLSLITSFFLPGSLWLLCSQIYFLQRVASSLEDCLGLFKFLFLLLSSDILVKAIILLFSLNIPSCFALAFSLTAICAAYRADQEKNLYLALPSLHNLKLKGKILALSEPWLLSLFIAHQYLGWSFSPLSTLGSFPWGLFFLSAIYGFCWRKFYSPKKEEFGLNTTA